MAKEKKTCPKCGESGTIEKLFGYRARINAEAVQVFDPQPWCRSCRAEAARQTARNKKNPKYVKPSQKRNKPKVKFFGDGSTGKIDRETLKSLYQEHYADRQARSYNFMYKKLEKKGVLNAATEREFAKLGNL